MLVRIIPARAGFTRSVTVMVTHWSDHPRSRGVYSGLSTDQAVSAGSSPLARGLLDDVVAITVGDRIIPARAGFTSRPATSMWCTRDHPRSRGVYAVEENVRGDPRWIIPARAGFTTGPHCTCLPPWDHPRSRGVYVCSEPAEVGGPGSSPLARGLRRHQAVHGGGPRIIPARAGFTRTSGMLVSLYEDHPRSRGVYRRSTTPTARFPGSSPLARGLRRRCRPRTRPGGIIPARAGFTAEQYKDWLTHTGSSPLARGLLTPVLGPPC